MNIIFIFKYSEPCCFNIISFSYIYYYILFLSLIYAIYAITDRAVLIVGCRSFAIIIAIIIRIIIAFPVLLYFPSMRIKFIFDARAKIADTVSLIIFVSFLHIEAAITHAFIDPRACVS